MRLALRAAWRGRLATGALACLLALAGCKKDEPKSTRWEDAAAAVASAVPATSAAPKTETGSFNRFFPKDGTGGYTRIFTADKEGYAEAKLEKDGKEVARLTIADADAAAKAKFGSATEKIAGAPVVKFGNNQSTALVKDKYQVKVSSPTLDHEARKKILESFDLGGLGS